MAATLNLFGKGSDGSREVSEVLKQLTEGKTIVPVEIEGTRERFYSPVRLRTGAVVFNFPPPMLQYLEAGGWVRICLPGEEHKNLRLEISTTPRLVGGNTDEMTLLCKLPRAEVIKGVRINERFKTEYYKDIAYLSYRPPTPYKIVDMSLSGMRICIPGENPDVFPLGKPLEHGTISLGNRVKIKLAEARPRRYELDTVGIENIFPPDGNSKKIVEVFIEWLRNEEIKMMGGFALQES